MRSDDWVAIVCGSRSGPPLATNADWVSRALDAFDAERRLAHLVQGGASGIDAVSANWAKWRRRPCTTFWADWREHGRVAGPMRNEEMAAFVLRFRRPLVLAFPGQMGTESMVNIAHVQGIPVWRCEVVDQDGFRWTETLR